MAVTSHDVARLAGVSQPTVSRALRDQAGVSATTRRRVREAARALGYVPIHAGRALSTQTTGRIGIVSAELGNPFYPALLEPLHAALAERGYRAILITDRGDAPVELEPLIDGSLDGVVLTTCERSSTLPYELSRRGLPFVMLNRTVDGASADACVADNRAGAAAVADLLISLGHRRIGAVLGPESTSTGEERALSFRDRLAEHGVSLSPRHVVRGRFAESTGRAGLRALLAIRPLPTALFCGNDVIALGVCNAAHAAGIDVPQQLTVVGFDDIPMAAWDLVHLTTVRSDLAAMARAAAALITARIAAPSAPRRTVRMPAEVVLRGTHAPPHTASRTSSRAFSRAPARTASG
jgi:LacI family transcriptional regulator